ncbi:MAG: sigma-54 dependent transcriptional regulator [Ginsengibacter sp.]
MIQLKNARVLVIDDDTDVLTAVRLLLKTEAKEVVTQKNPENILSLLSSQTFDIILLDMNFISSINTGNEGLFWLKKIKESGSQALVIMITAYGDIDLAVRSVKEGASDFIVKPWDNERLVNTIKNLLKEKDKVKGSNDIKKEANQSDGIAGESEVMNDIFYKVEKIAPTDANILVLGENGTGKDLIARSLHKKSHRASKPFIKVDVGALTESLFESELFGHKKGAYTGAAEDRQGRFEAANGGTLFLDEIGNISLQQQAKLLSVLQNRQITRLGTNEPINIDIRLICATNLSIQELANENRFRKDLVYRINTVEITMPPLRKREGDIILLANYFLKVYSEKYLKTQPLLSTKSIEKLNHYNFPGNVRELQYIMERAVIMSDEKELPPDDIIFSPMEKTVDDEKENENKTLHLGTLEKNAILKVIDKHNGNISKAAKELGLTRTALYRRLNKYEI